VTISDVKKRWQTAAGAKKPKDEKRMQCGNQQKEIQKMEESRGKGLCVGQSGRICQRNAVVETRSVSVTPRNASDAVLPQPVATVRPVPLNPAEYPPQFSQKIMLVSSLLFI